MKRITLLGIMLLALASPASSFAIAAAESFSVGYTKAHDIEPKSFTVKKGEKVRLEINPTDTCLLYTSPSPRD